MTLLSLATFIGAIAVAATAWAQTAPPSSSPAASPRVTVDGGTVVGVQSGEVSAFKGIPFAAPPVRGLRWKPPQPVAPWQGERMADRFAPMCLQPLRMKNSVFYLGEEPSSEDCLYLNVWSAAKPGEKKPVMVFVYGGGWTVGSGSLPLYSGEPLAGQGVVVVTFNYRLGALGFLAHPALTAEGGGASGNYGLMDMIAALKWVKANIERFGGDAGRVTLFGQSAGAAAISLLMVAPDAAGLFHRAIGQSGAYAIQGPYLKLAEAEAAGASAADKLRAKDLQALRDLGGDAVIAVDNNLRPIVDGKVLPQQPSQVYSEGKQMPIPILVGSNADEGTAYPVAMNAAAFEQDARKRYGVEANAFLGLYLAKTDSEARASSYALMRDRTFAAPVRRWASEQARVAPVFMYYFSRIQPFADGLGYQQQAPAANLGAYHGAEMAYAFGTLDALNRIAKTRNWTEEDRKYSQAMMSYWVSFATKADPNLDGLPAWQPYKPEEEQVLLFAKDIRMGDLPNRPQLDFFKGP